MLAWQERTSFINVSFTNTSLYGWGSLTTHALSVYTASGVTDYVGTYGYLYNWYAVNDSRKLCPTGWHVPTDAEWTILTDALGGATGAGAKMKSTGTTYWSSESAGTDNSSGFSALPGGYRHITGSFSGIRNVAWFWSATEGGSDYAWYYYLDTSNGDVNRDIDYKSFGASVRCLRD